MNILEQLREAEHFSSAEQNIIRYLLQYPETIINFSVRDLAKASYTSPSTVTRLVKKLDDGHGFSHFKQLLQSAGVLRFWRQPAFGQTTDVPPALHGLPCRHPRSQ